MRVTMMLADAAQAVGGKLYILGGGWSVAGPGPTPMAIAIKIEVPWDEANRPHALTLALLDEDGRPVSVTTPAGERPVQVDTQFEVGRPPGLRPGTPLDLPLAINVGPLPLAAGRVHVWRLAIDGRSEPAWQVSFSTRATAPAPASGEAALEAPP
jgi:hypothetical protein